VSWPGKTQPGKTKPGKTKPDETQPGKTQPGKTQPGETLGETRSGRIRTPGFPARGLLPLVIALAAWEVLAAWQHLGAGPSRAFPPPSQWVIAVAEMSVEGHLVPAFVSTLVTAALALAGATLVGAALGLALGTSRRTERALAPSLDFLASVPGAAIVPLAILLLGTTRLTSAVVVAVATVWPILLNTAAAARAIPPVRLEMSRTLGLSRGVSWRAVVLPSVAPGILVGARVASSLALIVTLLVDVVGTGDGVGRILVERQQSFDAAAAWGLVVIVGTVGCLVSGALGRLERRLLRSWPP
jgi:ABC-type nitrate/sulfonate/bicarbonate transport system permease component